jgi:hypothetical protein
MVKELVILCQNLLVLGNHLMMLGLHLMVLGHHLLVLRLHFDKYCRIIYSFQACNLDCWSIDRLLPIRHTQWFRQCK